MLILTIPLLGLCSKSTCLSPWFSICSPRQYSTIRWQLNLISGFFAFFWWTVWAGGINKCGWRLAGGRGCCLKGPHQIPSVSWIFHHSLYFHIYQIVSFVPRILCPLYCSCKWWGNWIGGGSGGWFISECGWGDRGWLLSHKGFFTCDFIFCCLMPCLFFLKWLEHDSCLSVSVFIICFLSSVTLTRSYWGIEIVVLVMWNYL